MFLTKNREAAIIAKAKEETLKAVRDGLNERRGTGPHSVDALLRCEQHQGNFHIAYRNPDQNWHDCRGDPTDALMMSVLELIRRLKIETHETRSKQAEMHSNKVKE